MFKRASLLVKLSAAFLLIAVVVASAGFYEVRSVNHLNELFLDLHHEGTARTQALSDLKTSAVQVENSTLLYVQINTTQKGQIKQKALAAEQANLTAYRESFHEYIIDYTESLSRDSEHLSQELLGDLAAGANNFLQASAAYINASQFGVESSIQTQQQRLINTTKDLRNNIEVLEAQEDSHVAELNKHANNYFSQLIRTVLILVFAVFLFATGLGAFVSTALTRSLKRLQMSAAKIANGDFSSKIPVRSQDEVGQLALQFNTMADRLQESYGKLTLETVRNRTLLESLGEGVIAIDEKTNIVLINDKALEILDLKAKKEKLVGIPVNQTLTLLDSKDNPLTGAQLPTSVVLHDAAPFGDVFGYRREGGAKILMAVTADPVVIEGKVAGAIMTMRDVTKEKEVDRMKTEFISLASHQLRTPLSAIKWFTEMLISGDAGKLQPDQLDFAKNISDSTERMIALVNALLNISRIESGRIMVDPKPTDLGELVKGIVNDLKAKTEEKQQSLVISVHQDLPKISLDPRLIGQVYLNLLTNAVKYTQKGGEISVFISRKDGAIISQVTDNGYGIPKEQQGRIFQKFFRAANAVKVETDGTGLGLYLIKAVVESSGGKIWFKSDEGKGTTFWFSIPETGMKKREGEVTLDV